VRVLICGGRDYSDRPYLNAYLSVFRDVIGISALCHGAAPGADSLAADWYGPNARAFPASWAVHGKKAGFLRNRQMLRDFRPQVVIAFPGGNGTRDMIAAAEKAGILVLRA